MTYCNSNIYNIIYNNNITSSTVNWNTIATTQILLLLLAEKCNKERWNEEKRNKEKCNKERFRVTLRSVPASAGRHFCIWDECIQAFALLLSLLSNANAQKIRDCNSLLEELHCDSATGQNTEGNDLKQYWAPYQTILGTIQGNAKLTGYGDQVIHIFTFPV